MSALIFLICAPIEVLSLEYGRLLFMDGTKSVDKSSVVERAKTFDAAALAEVEGWLTGADTAVVALTVLTREMLPLLERQSKALAASKNPAVKRGLLDAAFKLDLADVVPIAESLSLDPDADVRRAANECLCKNNDEMACLALDADNERVCSASKSLNPIGVALDRESLTPVVAYVCLGGPADRAGLREGDLITHVDGRAIDTPALLNAHLMLVKSHPKVTLQLVREDGTALTAELGRWR